MNWVIMPYVDNLVMTAQALRDVLHQRGVPDLRVLAIDNGSRNSALPFPLEELDQRLLFWRYHPALLSLSTVWNTALSMVWEAGGDHALVVNNDVRLHPETYEWLLTIQRNSGAWFVTGVGVREDQFTPTLDLAKALALGGNGREDTGSGLDHLPIGGPDFSCFLITKACHKWFQFDEGFIPAYHEDNDYHRRLQLAGFGDKIFGVNLPFLHYGSGTLKSVEHVANGWGARFAACQEYYVKKWGGLPGHETYTVPFNQAQRDGELGFSDFRVLLTGQGKPGHLGPWKGLFDGQAERPA